MAKKKYSIIDYGAVAGLGILALPSPEDAATFGASNFIGVLGLYMFYPEILQSIPIVGKILK